jgi:hypothetical protein
MFCTNCGSKLKDTAKFCGACGTRVEPPPDPVPPPVSARLELSPLAAGLPPCAVEIVGVEVEGPDDDGDVRVTVRYTLANDTDEDWEYIETRALLLSATGVIIDESLDTNEQTVSAGEIQEFEVGFWGVREQLLGSAVEQAGVILSVLACGGVRHSLGEFAVPSEPFSALSLPPGQMGDAIRILGGALWKSAADDDGDCGVTVKVLVQNLTSHSVPELKLLAPVVDRQGREVADAGTSDVLRPGAVTVIAGSGYAREKKCVGTSIDLVIQAYPALAAGVCQRDESRSATPSLPASFGPEVMRPYAKALSISDEIGHLMYPDCEVFYVSLNRYARDRYELVLDLRLREAFDDPDVWIYLEDHERVEYSEQANNFLREMGAYEALGLKNGMVDRCRMILDQDLETGSDEASGAASDQEPSEDSFDAQRLMADTARGVEDKLLERGSLKRYLGTTEYELSIVPVDVGEGMFELLVGISSAEAELSESDAEEICDFVSEKFREALEEECTREEVDAVDSVLSGISVALNGEKIY